MKKQNNFYFKYSKEEIKLVVIFNFMMEQSKLNPFTGDDYNKINQ
jgi:hypothetical protein